MTKSLLAGAALIGSVLSMSGCIFVVVDAKDGDSSYASKSHTRTIGIEMTDVSEATATQAGVDQSRCSIVTRVVPDSPAMAAGVHQWDIITHVDGKDWAKPSAVREAVRSKHDGESVVLKVARAGAHIDITIAVPKS